VAFATRRQVVTGAPFLQTQDCEGPPAAVEKFCLRTSEPRAILDLELTINPVDRKWPVVRWASSRAGLTELVGREEEL
jgi:hypothetical protein